jgi:hypothetical protein
LTSANKVLICLGMHRSGTSLVANWLHDLGINMGDRLVGPMYSNRKGHYEDADFHDLHEQIFNYSNIQTGGLVPPLEIKMNPYFEERMISLIRLKSILHPQWGWKEPRTCLFSEQYRKLLPHAKYIILLRDYPYVVDSLIRRDIAPVRQWYNNISSYRRLRSYLYYRRKIKACWAMANTYLQTWIIYNRNLLSLKRKLPHENYIVTSYATIHTEETEAIRKLKSWDFDIRNGQFKTIYDAGLMNTTPPLLEFDEQLMQEAEHIKMELTENMNSWQTGQGQRYQV